MDWDNVRVFLAVARGGQFVAAAKGLSEDELANLVTRDSMIGVGLPKTPN
jgi:hypothetical protein